ncbi:FAD-dependent monooxygenase [Sodalis sp. CWE]|uniref:FAD-dependent monooxygenase n=1 Tax=Sodalis sp. CWE TaxID=2803816 RepID=UPI001C7D6D6E|nr:FAD-dependent monooxygenase [Sodalis sp. CWE]MBX4180935.1 FAD-dependent monooxygenase [Sodalis sp. CWE]
MKNNNADYDIAVVGGGMIGSSLALMLAQAGFQMLLIDPTEPLVSIENGKLPDLRVSAINHASISLLRCINVWHRIDDRFITPYDQLEVWEWPISKLVFNASYFNLPELGFMVENWRIRQALWKGFEDCSTLTVCCPSSLVTMIREGNLWRLMLNDHSSVTSKIVIGADGENSLVRQKAGIVVNGWEYRQSCLLFTIEMNSSNKKKNITWQIFHPSGPRAFLPLYGSWASLVWYDSVANIRKLEALSLSELTHAVKTAFPTHLGAFSLHKAKSFSLVYRHINNYVTSGVALVGDAAHTVNPLAGQGANLGFLDVKTLAEILISALNRGENWDKEMVLKRYQKKRQCSNFLMQTGINLLYVMFSNDLLPIVITRNFGLMLMQKTNILKRFAVRYMQGL